MLVCIDYQYSEVRSYQLITIDNEKMGKHLEMINKTNTIRFPFSKFVDFRYDPQERLIIGVIENLNLIDPKD